MFLVTACGLDAGEGLGVVSLASLVAAWGCEKHRAGLSSPAGHLAEYSGMLSKSSGADSKLWEACPPPNYFFNFLVPSLVSMVAP